MEEYEIKRKKRMDETRRCSGTERPLLDWEGTRRAVSWTKSRRERPKGGEASWVADRNEKKKEKKDDG